MNIFKLRKFEWWNYMDNTIRYVELSKMDFIKNNAIEFLFSRKGEDYKKFSCRGVLTICMENEYEIDGYNVDEPYPYFVPDVYIKKLEGEELKDGLKYYRYGYQLGAFNATTHYLVCIHSTDTFIEIICKEIEEVNL